MTRVAAPAGRGAPTGPAARDLVATARRGLLEATLADRPAERYASAHLAALRSAAAVLAARARPSAARRRPSSVWVLLPAVAPELAEWATFFEAGAGKRAAAEAGLEHVISPREADDLLREVDTFLGLVETALGLDHERARAALPLELRTG